VEYKVIAMDLDGTLLDDNKRISKATKETIIKATSLGKHIVLISGRHRREMIDYAKHLELEGKVGCYLVSSDGIYIEELASNKIQKGAMLTFEQAADVFKICNGIDEALVVTDTCDYALYRHKNATYYKRKLLHSVGKTNQVICLDEVEKLDCTMPVEKLMLVSENSQTLYDELSQRLADSYHIQLCSGDRVEVLHKQSSKWNAVAALIQELGISAEQWLYFGDDGNDIQCMRNIKHSFAMGNTPEKIKQYATYVTAGNNDDGIAQALKEVDSL
jgi:hypothetical protein